MKTILPTPVLLLLLLLGALFDGDEVSAQDRRLEVVFQNDALIGILPGRSNSDREYTHGLWVAIEQDGARGWGGILPGLASCGEPLPAGGWCTQTRFEAGQKIFTPDYHHPWIGGPQRPFAGWLYGSVTARGLRSDAARSLRVDLGVTGAPSLAEVFQRFVHRIANYSVSEEGWDQQLAFEPGLLLEYGEERVIASLENSGGRVADLIPSWQATVGNVRTAAQVGATARVGHRLPPPWGSVAHRREPSIHAFVGARQNWIVRDLFLDGNTFQESARVEKRPFTTEGEIGAVVEYEGVRLSYSIIAEGRRYETQPRRHMYTAIVLSYVPER